MINIKKAQKMENEYVDIFFEKLDNNNNNEKDTKKLSIHLFQLINVELSDTLLHNYNGELDDETDEPIQFI